MAPASVYDSSRTVVALAMGLIFVAGCGTSEEPGPVPLTDATNPIKRLRIRTGSFTVRSYRTFWDFGDGPVEPMERIADLRKAIPEDLIHKLASKHLVQVKADRPPFERSAYIAHATVVSLDPDVMIVTVREYPADAQEMPFAEWSVVTIPRARHEYIESRRELIGARDVALIYFAGDLLPWSTEMYVVSCHSAVATGELTFMENQAEISFPVGRLRLTRKDGDVTVEKK
jgi:hypothetical protein